MTTIERKYALTKINPGDWLLPSNDAQTLYRLSTYEDGRSHGIEDMKDQEFWGVWKWNRRGRALEAVMDDLEDWSEFILVADFCKTRKEAIEATLR